MARVPRETFMPEGVRSIAYRDTAIPLGGGRYANLPMATGRLLTEAYLTANDRVLLIGLSTEASALVGQLSGSTLWRAPALAGALQNDPRTRSDRFTLTAELVPPAAAPASASTPPQEAVRADDAR